MVNWTTKIMKLDEAFDFTTLLTQMLCLLFNAMVLLRKQSLKYSESEDVIQVTSVDVIFTLNNCTFPKCIPVVQVKNLVIYKSNFIYFDTN